MGRTHNLTFLLLSTMLLGHLSVVWASSAEPSPWIEVHSTHYTVITDAGEKKGHEVALRFEQMRAVFGSLLMKDRLNEPVPLTIFAFKSDKSYYQAAPLHQGQPIAVPGFFVAGEDQDFIVLNLFEEESWRAVSYDYALALLTSNYPPVQGWFDEGMAEYFSSIRLDDKKYDIGGDPELHPHVREDLLGNQKEVTPPKSFTELLSGQAWLALPDLLTMKHEAAISGEGMRDTLFYAQSWILVHYLQHEKKMPETGTYFGLVEYQHVPVEEAIQKAYGMTAAQLDQAVKDYFHSLTPLTVAMDAAKRGGAAGNAPQVYEFPELVNPADSVITNKGMPEADARATVAEVKIRISDRRKAGLLDLKTLETMVDPATAAKMAAAKESSRQRGEDAPLVASTGNEIAHRALAWDSLQHGEFDKSLEELGDAAALNQRDMWVRYYLCVLKYRMAQAKKVEIEGLPNMLQDLRVVLEWYPERADAYDMMAVARMEGGGQIAAMQAERAAIQLSPRAQRYQYHLAEIYESDKKWDAAKALLQRLENSGDAKIAAEAHERLAQLTTNQKYGLSEASAASDKKLSAQSSPFDVLEQDAAKRAAEQSAHPATADTRPSKFFQGRLVGVDCSQSPAAVLTVAANGTVLKLRTSDYKALLLIGADSFSCEWNNRSVSVNYKAGGISDGDLLSVEVR